ncbi:MAG: dockerin type I domain-containing protein [Planctomycetes bacterium]|nr:dockerin type I domain-containing protein [Planctomycetota bacterium]
MQGELDAEYPVLRIQLMGVNELGQEAGNANTTDGRDIPWLQDVDDNGNARADVASDLWNVTFRDVVILDGNNVKVGVYNLTQHNLAVAENYSTLKSMLIDAAMTSQKPWRNPVDPNDVDNDQLVAPLDVLRIINVLNDVGPYELPPPTADESPPPYYDCNGDGLIAPIDVLQVINYLNGIGPAAAEGESTATSLLLDSPASLADGSGADPMISSKLSAPPSEQPQEIDDAARTKSIDRVFAAQVAVDRRSSEVESSAFDWLDSLAIGLDPYV